MAVKVRKGADPEKRLVFGEVYAPNRPDVDQEYMTAEDIETLAHRFLREAMTKQVDTQHNNQTKPKVVVVESFVAREGDPDFIPGSWVVGVHVDDDDLWQQVKDGKLNGFSVEALVVKESQEMEMEVPDEITGSTSEEGGHDHQFTVSYGDDGKLIGGSTSTVDGHYHRILAGTITEEANGHRHRFSSVDNLLLVNQQE